MPSAFPQLPADQQAVLSLVIRQGRSYDQIASTLGTDPTAVRGRAQQALRTLGGPTPADVAPADAERISDYLIGQQADAERIETLAMLTDNSSARAWARRVAAELAPAAAKPLPRVPDEPDVPAVGVGPARASGPERAPRRAVSNEPERQRAPRRRSRVERPPAALAPEPTTADREPATVRASTQARYTTTAPERSPTRGAGGRSVLAVAVILVAAAVVLFVTGSDGSSSPPTGPIPASAATATTTTTTSSSASGTDVLDQITLKPTAAGGGATGEAAVVKDGSQELITFAASHLASPGNGEYVLWLYNSPTQYEALGRVSSVKNGNTGSVAVALPSDASSYRGVMLTLETSTSPTSPGTAVLTGISSSPL